MINKIYIFLPIILIVVVIMVILFINTNKKIVLKNTTRFRLFYTNGYMMNADTEYEYVLEDGKYIMSIKPYLVDRENIISFEVDKSVIEEIETILNKYEVYKWNGFSKSDHNVLDGDSFSFNVKMNDVDISASGYMKYPDNYDNCHKALLNFLESIK